MKSLLAFIFTTFSTTVFADTDASFTLPSGVLVKITEASFPKKIFRTSGCTSASESCRINGHIPFGSDIELPKTYVKRILISYQEKSYFLDGANMYNAWGNRPLEIVGVVRYFGGKCTDTKNCQFRGIFSDGAGSFVAEWKIVNGLSNRTVLTNSSDITNLFMQHIDPPEFE